MANKHNRYAKVELNGKEKLLRFDINAMADFEERMGMGLFAALQSNNIGFSMMRAFYWAGLKWKDKGLTIERAGNMIYEEMTENNTSFEDLMDPITKALQASKILPEDEEEEEEEEETNDEVTDEEEKVKN